MPSAVHQRGYNRSRERIGEGEDKHTEAFHRLVVVVAVAFVHMVVMRVDVVVCASVRVLAFAFAVVVTVPNEGPQTHKVGAWGDRRREAVEWRTRRTAMKDQTTQTNSILPDSVEPPHFHYPQSVATGVEGHDVCVSVVVAVADVVTAVTVFHLACTVVVVARTHGAVRAHPEVHWQVLVCAVAGMPVIVIVVLCVRQLGA